MPSEWPTFVMEKSRRALLSFKTLSSFNQAMSLHGTILETPMKKPTIWNPLWKHSKKFCSLIRIIQLPVPEGMTWSSKSICIEAFLWGTRRNDLTLLYCFIFYLGWFLASIIFFFSFLHNVAFWDIGYSNLQGWILDVTCNWYFLKRVMRSLISAELMRYRCHCTYLAWNYWK